MAQRQQLSLFSETEFQQVAGGQFPVICPTLDLSATWEDGGKNLMIYRPPRQSVSKIHQLGTPGATAPEPLAVTWKPDGNFLAVGWSDGAVRLMGLESNKVAHHIKVCEKQDVKITHIGCAMSAATCGSSTNAPLASVESNLMENLSLDGVEEVASLPRELMFLEVDSALPKISPLPSSSAGPGDDSTVFSLRSGIDFLFQSSKLQDYDTVNIMIVGTSDGGLHLSIYDSFAIGNFPCPLIGHKESLRLIDHTFHRQLPTQCLLMANKSTGPEAAHLILMDLPFISSSPINLSLLASKLTTLQALLRYLKQTQLHMQVEWNNTRELPGRFLRSVETDLESMPSGPRGIVPALYHTVVTGHTYEPVREWLVDSLTERGHKRWDKAVVSGLEGLRSLVHENFLPALDRCSIILSRLRGLAQFYDSRDDIGFSVAQINRAMDIISCLTLVGHRILLTVMDELEHFSAFSLWLRFQIDRLVASSTANEELTEREATMNNSKVLAYIQQHLTQSPLDIFFDDIASEDYSADWEHIEDGPSLLDVLDKQLKKRDDGQPSMKALPHVAFLINYVTTRSKRIFQDIAEATKRTVRFEDVVRLSIGQPISKIDTKMCRVGEQSGRIYTALHSKESEGKVYIVRVGIDIVNGISKSQASASICIDLGSRRVVDLQFLNESSLCVLCQESDNSFVVTSVPIQSEELPYGTYTPDNRDQMPSVSAEGFKEFSLPPEHPFRPVRMEVHDKSDVRGKIPSRICLLGANGTTLQTFSMSD